MKKYGIDGCPRYRVFLEAEDAIGFLQKCPEDLVVKPIGLTGGKGVRIVGEHVDKKGAASYIRSLKGGVVLEERLLGEEFTLQAFSDGSNIVPMPLVQDHKRAYEGDKGPNTGGMGSYSLPGHDLPFVSESDMKKAMQIMHATIAAMEEEGTPYRGILYGQFMNTRNGPMVIEFNARFGDPEAMNVSPSSRLISSISWKGSWKAASGISQFASATKPPSASTSFPKAIQSLLSWRIPTPSDPTNPPFSITRMSRKGTDRCSLARPGHWPSLVSERHSRKRRGLQKPRPRMSRGG